MANVFAILTAIVLAVSAFLALKNYQAYYNPDPVAPGIIQQREKQEQVRETQTAELADLQDTLKATNEERTQTETTAEERLTVLQEQQKKNKDIEAKIASSQSKIGENQQQIDDMQNRLKETGDIETLVDTLKSDRAALERLSAGIDETQAKLSNLTGEVRRTDAVIAQFRDIERSHANKESYFPRARIRSVFGNWGFVTLSAGNAAGVIQGSILNVVRDGEVVAKLYVTAVEASSAAADIIPDSLAADTVLMSGDEVVPAKKDEAAAPGAPAAPAAPATTPAAEPPAAPAEEPAAPAEEPAAPAEEPAAPTPADGGATTPPAEAPAEDSDPF
jgi:hypothetical protein